MENCRRMRKTSHRDGKMFQGDKWRGNFEATEFENLTIQIRKAAHNQNADWWTCIQSSTDNRCCASARKTRVFILRNQRKSCVGFPKNLSRDVTPEMGTCGNSLVEDEEAFFIGRRKAAKQINEIVVFATKGFCFEQCPKQPSSDQERR